ncbi:hypothetical protein KAU11_09655 [Candidatus Babeliales bacterium]|nr:hypothetical protein [Candidatus Babeliales bacterium]
MTPTYFTDKIKTEYPWLYEYYFRNRIINAPMGNTAFADMICGYTYNPIVHGSIINLGYTSPDFITGLLKNIFSDELTKRLHEDMYDFLFRYVQTHEEELAFKVL